MTLSSVIRQRRGAAGSKQADVPENILPGPAVRSPRDREKSAPAAADMTTDTESGQEPAASRWSARSQWIFYALASGACAAFNGAFAKLTTTSLTSNLAHFIASLVGLSSASHVVEIAVRATFFALNLTFNGVMWTLFTKALAKGTSTTQVSIMNTSTNFVLTALLGLFIFSESLPPLWWVGASLLVVGNVIVGAKDESCPESLDAIPDDASDAAEAGERKPLLYDEDEIREALRASQLDEDMPDLGELPSEVLA
ncbi:hypothetical protein HIM_02670 [Hirsutella minnesotensis 3608]|nr:hypothetical protein HIM_02670 [Hirsutella minnesotensis 3608]